MVLLIDNYDSFTWNLAHRLGELGAEVQVVRNDAITVDELERLAPDAARDFARARAGRRRRASRSRRCATSPDRFPMLGVCLGHQALAIAFGGRVERASAPMHGKTSLVAHDGTHLFAGIDETVRSRPLSLAGDSARRCAARTSCVSAWVDGGRHGHGRAARDAGRSSACSSIRSRC